MNDEMIVKWMFIITALVLSVIAIIYIYRIQENIKLERNAQFYWFYSSQIYHQQAKCVYLVEQEKELCMGWIKELEALRDEYLDKIRQAE